MARLAIDGRDRGADVMEAGKMSLLSAVRSVVTGRPARRRPVKPGSASSRRARLCGTSVLAAGALTAGLASAVPAAAQPASGAAVGVARARPAGVFQTPGQASAQAVRTHRPVLVTGATTADSTLTAEPNGSFSVTEYASPVRAEVRGRWRDLDASLVRNKSGTYSPAVSSEPLALSGGGTGPMATMGYGSYSMALTAPVRLPAPVIAGNTATYRNVLPGVTLVVVARASGGFSDMLVVANARAAANPALRTWTFTTRTYGLTLRPGRRDTITATTRSGAVIFSAPAPTMWDSAVTPGMKTIVVSGLGRVDAATGTPAYSSVAGAGQGARTAPIAVKITGSRITLSPDRSLLAGTGPFYLDPTWSAAGDPASSWAYVSSCFSGQQYYNTSNYLQVGVDPGSASDPCTGTTSDSFYTLGIPKLGTLTGLTIDAVTAYFPEVWADSCTASTVDLYATGAISSSTTYDHQPSWGSTLLGSDDVAYGWSSSGYVHGPSSCGYTDKDVAFSGSALVSELAKTALPDGWSSLTVGLKAADTTNGSGWKLFANPDSGTSGNDQGGYAAIGANASWTINYAHTPSNPALSTSPPADCTNGTTTLGNGNVELKATLDDPDPGTLTATFAAYAAGDTADTFATNSSMSVPQGSGTTAILTLSQANLDSAASEYGSSGAVKITWTAYVSDPANLKSAIESCSFTFSDAIPGEPIVDNSAGADCGTPGVSYTTGTAAGFTFEANGNAATAPTSYTYQLNGGNPVTVTAGTSSPYSAAVSITPTRFTNVLIVNAVAAGGNIGQPLYCTFSAAAPAPAVDQDMTGDGIPDLLTVGTGTAGTASGLWLADGQADGGRFDGTVDAAASDIAPNGPQDVGTPSGWNGLKAITGQFTDNGFNDVEAYQPGTGNVYVLPGQGDGSATTSDEQNLADIFADTSQVSGNTNYPQQLVNAYSVSADGGTAEPYPDQIGVFTDPDSAVGSYLGYFADSDGFNSFDAANYGGLPYELTNDSPDGTMDWNDWTITTDYDTRGGTAYTDMWLWDSQTGALYLWELAGLEDETAGGFSLATGTTLNPAATLAYAQIEVSADWNKGAAFSTLQATDVDGDPGLIAVTSAGQVDSYADISGTISQVNASGAAQTLLTATHSYPLNDGTSGESSTADDQAGAGVTAQNLAGNGGTDWNNGDMFSPDVLFNGTSGYMTTSSTSGLFTPDSSFTISAWADPSKLGGTVFSQDGTDDSSIEVSSTTSGAWSVGMNTGGTTSATYDTATGGTAHAGMWTDLVVAYDTAGGADTLKLYADGVEVAYVGDTSPPATTGNFLLGADQSGGASSYGSYFTGQIADVQVWDSLAIPVQPATPPSVFVPITPVRIMDTRSASKIGPVTGPIAADGTATLPIDGITTNGVDLPASGITAVAIAITVTGQTEGGFITTFPAGTPRPETSAVNFTSSGNYTNNAIVPVGPGGGIEFYNGATSSIQLITDITGYFTTNTTATGASTYTPLADPTRILDTRNGTGAPEAQIAADGTLTLTMDGDNTNGAGLPASGVTAVALNLTVVPADGGSGILIAYPDGVSTPSVSLLSYRGGYVQAGTILIPVGSDGKIDIFNSSSDPISLVGDLSGYFTTSTTGQYYHPLDSTRLLDTRQTSAMGADAAITIDNPASILANNPTLVLDIVATEATAPGGYLVAYPAAAAMPDTSLLSFVADGEDANLALVNTATSNASTIDNQSAGTVQVVVDTNGYFE
jgi:Concanavalin A-like lectin/glucanases superfamily